MTGPRGAIAVVISALAFGGCAGPGPTVYRSVALSGVVINAESGSPIKGARVADAMHPEIFVETNDMGDFTLAERLVWGWSWHMPSPRDLPTVRTVQITAEDFETVYVNPEPYKSGALATVKLARKPNTGDKKMPNSAVKSDAYASALRASFGAPNRER